ncbi:winged helix-turn-helix domain-containing protein [Rheinheimera sp. NSM]|uniref:winged helix-turn-helix domain-containing protein n=1 Tax=Rheinheimera sp. NSM TaxID=3457884 RepID=UPI00403743BA
MFKVGDFVFNYSRAELIKDREVVKIEPQINELLKLLVDNAGELVSKDRIVKALWSDRVITDDAFRAVIKKLRKYLQDSARDSRYVRTLPLKGYILIADVAVTNGTADKPTSVVRTTSRWLIACSLLFCAIALLGYVVLPQPARVTLTSLTAMEGSEVSPSYNAEKNLLIFSHRANKDDYLQLYARALDSGRITRLTFDEANYANGHLSANGDKIAYTRSTPAQTTTFIADFSAQHGLSSIYALPDEVSEQRYLQAWSSDGSGLYLSDLKQPGAVQGIWYYQLASQELSSVTSSGGFGSGDYFARESHDGQFLAILRNTGANDNELLVQHLPSGELVHVHKLAHSYQHLVWDNADRLLTLASFYAEFAQYDLARGQLKVLPLNIENINHAFYSCGERCLFARQHSGNYLDLVIQPNPFSAPVLSQYDYLQFSGAEDFPVTGQQSGHIYLVNKQHKESQIAVIQGNGIKVLKVLPVDSEFTALQVNPSETHLAGIVNGRLFLLALASEQFQFLTTELEQVASVQWTVSGEQLHYARIEHGKPVLYRYELEADVKVRVEPNVYAKLITPNNEALVVDSDANVWRYEANSAPVLLTRLPDVSANRWQVQQNWLYYTGHEENLAYLYRIHITTGATEKQLIAKNRFRLNFDLSADGTTMLAVRSVLAQSDLVKLQY